MFVASVPNHGNILRLWPKFSLWRECDLNVDGCKHGWLKVKTLNMANPQPTLVHANGTVGVYEMMFTANNSFESNDVLGLYVSTSTFPGTMPVPLYQRGGGYCDTVGTYDEVERHTLSIVSRDLLPYIAVETGQPYTIV